MAVLFLGIAGLGQAIALADPPPTAGEPPVAHSERAAVLDKRSPTGVADLRAIESQVVKLADPIRNATVAIIVGDSQGSGVIVSADGIVLTAAHVVAGPGRKVSIVMEDGRRVSGRSLGINAAADTAMVQILDHGPFPACQISDMRTVKLGDWCLATGHPGGYQTGRPPVMRLGRIVAMHETFLQTDCPLLGGDSGGPLFDLSGHVIGVHSRIGPRTSLNLHVSASLFIRDWNHLKKSPVVEEPATEEGMLGLDGDNDSKGRGARVTSVFRRLPASRAGLKTGDIVTKFAGQKVENMPRLKELVRTHRPGETVELSVLRDDKPLELRATLVARPTE